MKNHISFSVLIIFLLFLQKVSNILQVHKPILYICNGLPPGYNALFFLCHSSNCWDCAKLHKGSMEIWTPHPGPEIEFSLFFLVTLFLYFFFPTGSGFTWSRYLLYGLIRKLDYSDKSGIKRKSWTEVLSIFVNSFNYAWLHRSSLPLVFQ